MKFNFMAVAEIKISMLQFFFLPPYFVKNNGLIIRYSVNICNDRRILRGWQNAIEHITYKLCKMKGNRKWREK